MSQATPQTPIRKTSRSTLAVVFTTILIDFTGFSVLIPVLPLYAKALGATPFEVGLILSSYALAQLIFLPTWGWVSDRVGRRPVILVSLLGTAVSFVLLALADTLALIYAARVLGGFFAASIGTAQAIVTDVTPPEGRARGMGLIGATFGLGFVIGPFLGGELSALHPRLPFVAVALLSAVNLVLAWRRLPETRPPRPGPVAWGELPRTLIPAPVRLVRAVHDRRIALYLLLFLLNFIAFAAVESMLAVFLEVHFGLDARAAGRLFAYIGLFIALTQGLLVGRLVSHFGEVRLVILGWSVTALSVAAIALVPDPRWYLLVGPCIAFGNGISLPSFTSLYSKACREDQAGELMSESQSMATTGRILGPLWGGFALQAIAPSAPFLIAGVLMGLTTGLFVMLRGTLLGQEPAGEAARPVGAASVDRQAPSPTVPAGGSHSLGGESGESSGGPAGPRRSG